MPPDCNVTDAEALTGAIMAALFVFPLAFYVWREDRRDRAAARARKNARLSETETGRHLFP